jgi:hypothetical protein
MDKPDKPNVRFTDISKAHTVMERVMSTVTPASDLTTVIPDQEYSYPGPTKEDPMGDECLITIAADEVDPLDSLEAHIQLYQTITSRLENLFREQSEIFDRIMATVRERPALDTAEVARIEARVRADMISKFNDMFK